MNIGVFLHDYPPDAGGGYTFQAEIFRALAALAPETSHSFTVFTSQAEELNWVTQTDRFRIHAIPDSAPAIATTSTSSSENSYRRNLIRRVAAKAFRRPGPSPAPQPSLTLEKIFKQAGIEFVWYLSASGSPIDIPYLIVVWDLQHRLQPWFPEVSEKGEWEDREAVFTRLLQRAAVVVTGNEAGRKELKEFYQIPDSRIKTLPHPTPEFCLRVGEDKGTEVLGKHGISPGYLLYPAQFWPHKNHVNLLLAVRELREEHGLVFPLVFVGSDKGNHAYVREVVKQLDLTDQVSLLGFVSQTDLAALYRNAFALTYVTFFGPENLPPLEAFAFGCPVIGSRVSGAEEQLGDAALLVNPAEPHEIALAVKSLADNPTLRQTLIKAGAERAAAWTGTDFVRGVFSALDEFASIRRSWGPPIA